MEVDLEANLEADLERPLSGGDRSRRAIPQGMKNLQSRGIKRLLGLAELGIVLEELKD